MKRTGKLLLGIAVLLALLAGVYCLIPRKKARADARPSADSQVREGERLGEPRRSPVTNSPVVAFASWTKQYLEAASASEKEALLADGEELAKARLVEMYELIKTNPKEAIERSVSYDQRKQLPQSIVSFLEEPVNGKGDYMVLAAYPAPGQPKPENPIQRKALLNGNMYDTYVYGRRRHQVTRENIPLHGVAVGNRFALSEDAVRVLSQQEATDAIASGAAKSEAICSVSGDSSTVAGQQTLVQLGDKIANLCRPDHARKLNSWMAASENEWRTSIRASGGSYGTNLPPEPGSITQGRFTLLYMRVRFLDDPVEPISEGGANAVMNGANRFFVEASYNTASIISTVTPLLTLPYTKEWYSYNGPFPIATHAYQVSRATGFDPGDYDLVIVGHGNVPGDAFGYGGLAFVGGPGIWLQGGGNSTGVACHELGHNFSLWHANFLDQRFLPDPSIPRPPNPNAPQANFPIDPDSALGHDGINVPGENEEYGDVYDTMGSAAAGISHFSAPAKNRLNWLPASYAKILYGSSTNRMYAYDVPDLIEGRTYALRIQKDLERRYWFSHRQLWVNNPWMANGVEVHYEPYSGSALGSHLIDTTPGTGFGRQDAAIVIGRTFSDWEAGIHVTPITRGRDDNQEWVDVVVHQGAFPENLPPTLNLNASALFVSTGENVTFTATSSDPNGDMLAYNWDFSDGTFGTNSAQISRAFPSDGYYVVRCEVSDMKGGVTSSHLVVRVGTPTTFTMSGQVIDTFANPVANVRVHNGRPGAEYRYNYTDSQGYYTIADVLAGDYNNNGFLYHYKTIPLAFFNPVTIGGANAVGLDHLANPITKVSIVKVSDGNETGSNVVFEVSRIGDINSDLRVLFALSGTAIPSSDYEPLAEDNVIIPAGQTSTLLSFNTIADTVSDGMRDLRVSLRLETNDVRIITVVTNINGTNELLVITNALSYRGWELINVNNRRVWYQTYPVYVIGTGEATAKIFDADPPAPPTVSLSVVDDAGVETGNDYASVVITREGNLDGDLVVRYTVSGVASNGIDYVYLPGTITIPGGVQFPNTFAGRVLAIVPYDDLFVEGNEDLTITLLQDPSYAIGNGSATVYIVENDLPLITINSTDPFAFEPTQATGQFTITRSGNVSQDLTVYYLLTGSAQNGVDYTALPGDVVIPAGQLSANIIVRPINDPLVESNEIVTIVISDHTTYNIGLPNSATVTILDGSLPEVTLRAEDANATEGAGNSGLFVFTRSGPLTNTLLVNFEVAGTAVPQADYQATGTNILFPVNVATMNLNIVAQDDNFRETNETVILKLVPSPTYHVGNPNSGTVTIDFNDNSDLPEISFATRTSSVLESAGQALLTVRMSASIGATNVAPAVVEWRISGGSATFDTDYSLLATGYVTFDFDTPIIQDIAVQLTDDILLEPSETLLVTLFHPNLWTTNIVVNTNNMTTNTVYAPVPTNAFLGSYRTHTLTILDDDSSVVSLSVDDRYAFEAGRDPAVITISREGSTNSAQAAHLAIAGTAAGGNDYVALPRTVVIPPGSRSVTLTILPFDDPEEEVTETITVTIVRAPGASIGTGYEELFVVDNDGTIQFASPIVHAPEYQAVGFVGVVRSGDTNLAGSVQYVIQEGTATLNRDFFATNGTLNFAPGETTKTIPISILNDFTVEADETVFLYLTNASGGVPLGGQITATFFIDNDDTTIQFASQFSTANENSGTAAIEVVRVGVTSATNSVGLITVNGTATNGLDYTGVTNTVSFGPGETSKMVNVPITDDFLFEGNEFLTLVLRNPSTNTILTASNAALLILDDECSLAFATTTFATNEYEPAVHVIVSRIGGTVNPVSVDYTTFDGTASNGLDYASASGTLDFAGDRWLLASDGSGRLEFHPGDTQKILLVGLIDDTIGDGNETFHVRLSNARAFGAPPQSVVLGTPTNASVLVLDNEAPGNVDYEHNPGQGANARVLAVALQSPDNRAVFGGQFTAVDNIGFNRVARLHVNGAVDTSFNPGQGANQEVLAIATQSDQKILIGGAFTIVDGASRGRIARLNANGSLDGGFGLGSGANGIVRAIAVQPDGRILIAGDFTFVHGTQRQRVARLNPDGSIDFSFLANVNNTVNAIGLQSNGRIVIGGSFTSVGNLPRASVARLNPNGSLDLTFDPGTGANAGVNALAVMGDGKVVLGGGFTGIDGIIRNRIARLNVDGTVDTSFDPGTGANGNVNTLAVAATGRIVIGGEFTNIDGMFLNRFARLKVDGKVDTSFDPGTGADGAVRSLVLQGDTAIVMGGDFTVIDSIPRNRIARIHGDEKSNVVGVEFASAAPSVIENGGQVAITVVRSGNTNVPFSIRLLATNGTATAGADYVPTNVLLNFASGELAKSVNVRVLDDNLVEPAEFVELVLTNGSPNVDLTSTAPGLLTIVDNEQSFRFGTNDFVALEDDGFAVVTVARDGLPAGTVTVEFRVQDGTATAPGDYTATNRVLTFTNGEAAKIIVVQLTNDRQEEGTETAQLVLANPTGAFLGTPATASLTILDTDITYGTFNFESTNRITIFDGTPAVPYPSTINVSGLSGVVGRVEVTLSNLSHTFPDDIDILLVAPYGRSVVLMSDAGGSADVVNLMLRISDLATSLLPNSALLTSGTNQPTDFEPGDAFPGPAPGGPHGAPLNWLNGGDPNGDWKLFVRDDRGSDTGEILNGWKLHITTVNPETITDLALGIEDSPDPLQAGEMLTYTLSLTNLGPRLATGVKVTDLLPPDVEFIMAIPSQGTCAQSNATVICDLGGIDVNGLAQISISVMPLVGASMTNTAFMTQDQHDIQVPNNSAVAVTTVNTAPVADLVISMTDNPDPIFAGQNLTYSINVTNKGPLTATGVTLTDTLPANVSFISATSSQGQCGLANGRVTCNLGVMANGSTGLVSIVVRPLLTGKIVNAVSVIGNEGDFTLANAFTETTVYPSADLSVFQTDSQDPFPLGGVLTYIVIVTNHGPNIARGVNIIDTLPANAPLDGVLASQGSCYVVGSLLICDFGMITNGGSASVAIDVRPNNLGFVQNSATVLAGDFDTVASNNTWTETTAILSFGGGLIITPNTNAMELAAAVTASGSAGITVTSARLIAHAVDEAASSGVFTIGSPPFTYNLTRPGIVLSSGNVDDYESGPNQATGNTFPFGPRATVNQELLLDPITGVGTNNFRHFDATQLDIVFDMLPGFDRVEFKVVFGSEEYSEFVGSSFIDGFGLYLNGSNIAFTAGAPININHPAMRTYPGTELDGILAPNNDPILTFSAAVPPGSTSNTLTIIVCDTSDTVLDTTVFVSSLQGAQAPNADLAASIASSPEPVLIGTPLTYTMTALNRGPDTATNVTLVSRVPQGMALSSFATSQGFCFVNQGILNCFLNNLPRGSNAQVQLTVFPGFEGRFTNSVTVGSDLADLRDTNNTAFVVSTVVEPGAFFNTSPIFATDAAPGVPYPSVINVSGLNGAVGSLTVTLSELTHSFPADLDILLVSPTGQKALLMSDVGQGNDAASVSLKFDDTATSFLPQFGALVSGTFKPTNIGDDENFYSPAPSGPYGSSLSVFAGDEPNGPWSLYVMDDQGADSGAIATGWRLTIVTGAAPPAPGLEIALQNDQALISWPDPSPGYILESTDALGSGATWTVVPNAPTSIGGRLRVNLPAGSGDRFFRLRKGPSP
jgi:uncharacterized repeat protein (TIGR01451 family)/uncharacterized delta-60 repeat protein